MQETAPHEARAAWFGAAYELLDIAVNAQPNPSLLPPPPPSAGTKVREWQGMQRRAG